MVKSVYIHIPFCNDICSYCDFCKFYYNSYMVDKYLDELENEVKKIYKGEVIKTIYIGGGTPSSLSIEQLKRLFKIINHFNKDIIEFTFECNIENIDEEKTKLIRDNGVNRISIGIQTFNGNLLSFLNRKHKKKEVKGKLEFIKKYFDNINVDLMYAIPGETIEILNNDINQMLELGINHISTYSLILENNTILKNMNIEYIDEDLDYSMYELICNKMKDNGFIHYETSNFCRKGFESKHNLTYWNNEEYYGFGLGASGYIDNVRYTNTRSINHYLDGKYRYEEEKLNINETIENEFILGFRKVKGINIDSLLKKYNLKVENIDFIQKLIKENKLIIKDNYIYINDDYIYTSNDILIEFMGVDYERYI